MQKSKEKRWQQSWFARREQLKSLYNPSKTILDGIETIMEHAWADGREKQLDETLVKVRRIQAQLPVAGNSRRLIYMLIDELEKQLSFFKS